MPNVVRVRKQGNSLTITIPKALNEALKLQLRSGDYVEMSLTAKASFEFKRIELARVRK